MKSKKQYLLFMILVSIMLGITGCSSGTSNSQDIYTKKAIITKPIDGRILGFMSMLPTCDTINEISDYFVSGTRLEGERDDVENIQSAIKLYPLSTVEKVETYVRAIDKNNTYCEATANIFYKTSEAKSSMLMTVKFNFLLINDVWKIAEAKLEKSENIMLFANKPSECVVLDNDEFPQEVEMGIKNDIKMCTAIIGTNTAINISANASTDIQMKALFTANSQVIKVEPIANIGKEMYKLKVTVKEQGDLTNIFLITARQVDNIYRINNVKLLIADYNENPQGQSN